MFRVRDRIKVKDKNGKVYLGRIININIFREPNMKYCVDLDDFPIGKEVFVGEEDLEFVEEDKRGSILGD